MPEWFEEWFGEEYLELYPHRDEHDAERAVALLRRLLPWRTGWRVLDVGCGAGRHARALELAGARCIGLDLSASLLRRAREVTRGPLVRADMRTLPVRPRSMDLTVNLFTSFGYFATDAEHAATVAEMVETVRHGGWFALDFLNAPRVRGTLVPAEAFAVGDKPVEIRRWVSEGGRYVHKAITIGDGRRFEERVRLFDAPELERMMAAAGATPITRLGDYDGGGWSDAAPRTLVVGRVE